MAKGWNRDRSSRIFYLGAGWRWWSASLSLATLTWSKEPRQALETVISLRTTEESKSLQGIASRFTESSVRNVSTTLTELSRLIWIRLSYAVCTDSATGVDASMRYLAFFVEIRVCTPYRCAFLVVRRFKITIVWHVTLCTLIDTGVSEDVLDTHSRIGPMHFTYLPNSRLWESMRA